MEANNGTPVTQIPGPRSVGGWRMNMFHFFRSPLMFQRWLYHTYGNLVAMGQGDRPTQVFAFGPELNRQILTNPEFFEISTALVRMPKDTVMGRMFFNNLSLMKGEKHKQHRRLMQPAFHHEQILQYSKDMFRLTKQLSDEWQDKAEIDLNLEMKKLTQRIAVKTLFGLYNEEELNRIGTFITQMTKSILLVSLAPFNFPYTPYHRALRNAEQLNTHIRSMIEQKRLERNATDVLASLVKAHDEDGTTLTDEELIGHTFNLFVASHETTANALTWTIFLLSQHPDILYNLLEELKEIENELSLDKLSKLPLLEGVVKESLRLLPPASVGVRITASSCELGGFSVPEKTNVFFSQLITHRMPELYDEPNRFIPERWSTIKRTPFEYLPFSAGPHMCIGWGFAMQEMKIVLAVLLMRYRFSVVHHAKISPNLMMRPVSGMPMRIFPQDWKFGRVPVRGTINQLIDF
ncbi:cytochrome P450 [Paenibacillus sp. OSY-SE]|uniref:cytochrome P450 n=1 Tax=Paenibacillus sp. OSY-SE TaxID=1196323 RepID=UPI0002FEF74C|nr:cytochrome P450 [Paenibacillus sp. OSY-SE]